MTLETCANPLSCSASLVGVGKHKKHSADNKLCLPSIATFSHHGVAILRHRQKKATASPSARNNAAATFYYCSWPNCTRAASKKPFKKACHLRYHMSLHTGDSIVSCPECGRQFNRTYYLRQHMLKHTNAEPYVCQHCDRRYTHKSEASLCRKRHKAKDQLARLPTPPALKSTSLGAPSALCDSRQKTAALEPGQPSATRQLSALELEMAIDRARVRPYACSSCPRRYTDPSSLRKHIRSHHDSSAVSISTAYRHQNQDIQSAGSLVALRNGCQLAPTDPENSVRNRGQTEVEASSEVGLVQSSTYSHTVAATDVQLLASTAVATMEQECPGNEVIQSLPLEGERPHQLHSDQLRMELTDADFTLPPSAYWNSPVDLCNSAMCLQTIPDRVTDVSSSAKLEWNNRAADAAGWSVNNNAAVAFQSCEQDGALDLTDAPNSYLVHFPDENEAIDLSGNEAAGLIPLRAYPIDLSSGNPFGNDGAPLCHNPVPTTAPTATYYPYSLSLNSNVILASSLPSTVFALPTELVDLPHSAGVTPLHSHWEPEPGFSFTDLLLANGDDQSLLETPHGLATCGHSQPTGVPVRPEADNARADVANGDFNASSLPNAVYATGFGVSASLSEESAGAGSRSLPPLDLRLLL